MAWYRVVRNYESGNNRLLALFYDKRLAYSIMREMGGSENQYEILKIELSEDEIKLSVAIGDMMDVPRVIDFETFFSTGQEMLERGVEVETVIRWLRMLYIASQES